jgi:hypothetical protein
MNGSRMPVWFAARSGGRPPVARGAGRRAGGGRPAPLAVPGPPGTAGRGAAPWVLAAGHRHHGGVRRGGNGGRPGRRGTQPGPVRRRLARYPARRAADPRRDLSRRAAPRGGCPPGRGRSRPTPSSAPTRAHCWTARHWRRCRGWMPTSRTPGSAPGRARGGARPVTSRSPCAATGAGRRWRGRLRPPGSAGPDRPLAETLDIAVRGDGDRPVAPLCRVAENLADAAAAGLPGVRDER